METKMAVREQMLMYRYCVFWPGPHL